MAKREKKDHSLNAKLSSIEQKIFQLKIQYEKYFSGLEKLEPITEYDQLQKMVRELMGTPITNTQQRYRFTQLRARLSSLSMYWKRNLVMIERGTHPKMQFRANLKEQRQREMELRREQHKERRERANKAQQSDSSYRSVYDQLLEARRKTGQSTNISFDNIKATLEKQSKAIRSQYQCSGVKFKVSIQNGKAKMKAVPIRDKKDSK